MGIIAQIDTSRALRDLPATMKEADVVLLSRGAGTAVAPEKMFACRSCCACAKRENRADAADGFDDLRAQAHATEATDIANIVLDGADALLLGLRRWRGSSR